MCVGGGYAASLFFFLSLFPVKQTTSEIGHFFGLATKTLNVRNNNFPP